MDIAVSSSSRRGRDHAAESCMAIILVSRARWRSGRVTASSERPPSGARQRSDVDWSTGHSMAPGLQRIVRLISFADEERTRPALRYWLSRPPMERVGAVEYLRRQIDGSGARLRRVYRVLDCPWG